MSIQIQAERLAPLTDAQVREYHENGYIVISKGCSDDLINMFNSHVHSIRSSEVIPDWAKPKKRQ